MPHTPLPGAPRPRNTRKEVTRDRAGHRSHRTVRAGTADLWRQGQCRTPRHRTLGESRQSSFRPGQLPGAWARAPRRCGPLSPHTSLGDGPVSTSPRLERTRVEAGPRPWPRSRPGWTGKSRAAAQLPTQVCTRGGGALREPPPPLTPYTPAPTRSNWREAGKTASRRRATFVRHGGHSECTRSHGAGERLCGPPASPGHTTSFPGL